MDIDESGLQEMRQAFEKTGSVYKTSLITGYTQHMVGKNLKKEIREHKRKEAEQKKAEKVLTARVEEEFKRLGNIEKTAKELNLEVEKTREILNNAGYGSRLKGKRSDGLYGRALTPEQDNLMIQMANEGKCPEFIAAKVHCSPNTVRARISGIGSPSSGPDIYRSRNGHRSAKYLPENL
jgi:hypothetical protein